MPSPGGVEVGRVSVRVVPDTSKFLKEAKKELKKISEQLRVDVTVGLDTKKFAAELKKVKSESDKAKVKMGVEVDGDGVVRETRRIRNAAQKLVGAIRMTVGINSAASLARIKAELEVIKRSVQAYNIRIPVEFVGLSKWLGILGAISGILLTIPHLIGAIGGMVTYVGGALALLPALAGAAAFGIGALVVGMKGFASALGASGDPAKFAEALKELTPSAQAAAKALASFRQPLSEIRKAVQESLFKNMAKPLNELKVLLPGIRQGLVGSAAGIREMARAWITMATSQRSIKDTSIIGQNVTKMFEAMRPAAANFGQAMRDIAVVGSTFLPQLGLALSNVTKKFANWATEARKSGRLAEIIDNFIEKTKQLGRIIADVWMGFKNIFSSTTNGEKFLDIIERITQNFREWSADKETQATFRRLGEVMRVVADAAAKLFGEAFKAAGKILKDLEPFLKLLATTIGVVLVAAIKAVTPILQDMAKWLSENKEIMVPLAIVIISLVTSFKLLATAAKGIVALRNAFLVLKSAGTIVGTMAGGIGSSIGKMARAVGTATGKFVTAAGQWIYRWGTVAASATFNALKTSAAWAASALRSAVFSATYYALMAKDAIAAFLKIAAAAVFNAAKTAAAWIANLARMVAATIAEMAIVVATWVASWAKMAWTAAVNAAKMAASWLVAMGPIGWIIAAVIALAAVIIYYWDEISLFLKIKWAEIKENAITAWEAITGFFKSKWQEIKDNVSDAWNGITLFLSMKWQAIKDNVSSFVNSVGEFFGSLWEKIKTGVSQAAEAIWTWAKELPGKIWEGIKSAGSTLADAGRFIIEGLVNGLRAAAGAIKDFIMGICADVLSGIKNFFGISSPSKVMMQIGKWINQGWAIGLKKNASVVGEQATAVAGLVLDAFAPLTNVGSDWASSVTASTPEALASVRKLMDATNGAADMEWKGHLTSDDMKPIEERFLTALASGLEVTLDGRNVAQSVNTRNRMNSRRK